MLLAPSQPHLDDVYNHCLSRLLRLRFACHVFLIVKLICSQRSFEGRKCKLAEEVISNKTGDVVGCRPAALLRPAVLMPQKLLTQFPPARMRRLLASLLTPVVFRAQVSFVMPNKTNVYGQGCEPLLCDTLR